MLLFAGSVAPRLLLADFDFVPLLERRRKQPLCAHRYFQSTDSLSLHFLIIGDIIGASFFIGIPGARA